MRNAKWDVENAKWEMWNMKNKKCEKWEMDMLVMGNLRNEKFERQEPWEM